VEQVEGAKENISPKVAAAGVTGVGRRGQAVAAVIRIAREIEGRERSARGAGLGRVNDPDPSRVGLAVPEWAGLGQMASWAKKKALAIYLNKTPTFKFECYFLFEFNSNSKLK
jgi:hypothetical protein